MVEVFKTNIQEPGEARIIARLIEREFAGCEATFDLEDCDKILRINFDKGIIDCFKIISLLNYLGFKAEILQDLIVSQK